MNSFKQHKVRFIKIFTRTLIISSIVAFMFFFLFKLLYSSPVYDPSLQRDATLVSEKEAKAEDEARSKGFLTAPVRTNILIAGVDENENLTDVMMVASFISTTGEINIISMPRDTYTTFSGDSLKELRSLSSRAPSIMKLNAVHSYTQSMEFLQSTLEDFLGINIDYYVKINLNAFREIVDAVGGIYFEIPAGGLKYSDPTQHLYINLAGGYQLLDGDAAEGLVRFRDTYTNGDLDRVLVQQEFIKEFIKQVLQKETLIANLGEIAMSLLKYVETDFTISDISRYITAIDKIDTNKINTTTAPGSARTIDGASYYILDTAELNYVVDEYFYGNTDPDLIENDIQEEMEN